MGHWGMMKAMIQMQPRGCLFDNTIFSFQDVEESAKQLSLNLRVFRDLHALPVVLQYMRAPLPFHWVQHSAKTRKSIVVAPQEASGSNRVSGCGL